MKQAGRILIVSWAAMAVAGCLTGRLGGGSDADAGGTATGTGARAIPRLVLNVVVKRIGSGSGTVTSNPTGITCGSVCEYLFPEGTTVSLTATPDAGSAFGGWRGAGCTGTGVCRFTAGARVTVTATFVRGVAKPVRG